MEFELSQTYYSFFYRNTAIRRAIEFLRGDMNQHAAEGYARLYKDLNHEEMVLLINAIKSYIKNNQTSDMSCVDNQMIHCFICNNFLAYELDFPSIDNSDSFRTVINDYFLKLNQELQLLSVEQLADSSYASINIWLTHLMNYPSLYINHSWIGGHGNDYSIPFLGLEECGCIDVSHDRLLSDVRSTVERMVLNECKKVNLANSENPIKILSMGPGKGMQEFIILWKLLQMGIRNIELSLVEPRYSSMLAPIPQSIRKIYCRDMPEGSPLPEKYYTSKQGDIYNIIRATSLLSRYFIDANIRISQYSSLENLTKDKEINAPFDIAFAIDFEDYSPDVNNQAYQDFHSLAGLLKPKGKAIVSAHYQIRAFEVELKKDGYRLRQTELVEFEQTVPTDKGYQMRHTPDNYFKIPV